MKKIIFFLATFISLSNYINAQGFGFGAKVGANMNKISGQQFNQGYELGYHLGAFAEIGLGKKFGIQPELIFNQINNKKAAGGFSTVANGWKDSTSSIQLKYLTIPLLLRFKLTDNFILNVGPQYGILVSKDKSTLENGQEAIKNGDFSMAAGVTINISSLRIIGRYNVGLADISDVSNTDSWKTQQIQIGIGYRIL